MFQMKPMRKNRLIVPLALMMSAVLSACGGGGDTGGAFQSTTTTTTTSTVKVATVTATTTAQSIPTDGSASADIKVYVRDASNVLLANVPVTFSASSGGLSVGQATTDSSGIATATLVTAGDKTVRTITVTASAGGVSSTATVSVTASNTVTVSSVTPIATPASIPTDGTTPSEVRVYVRNSANQLIAGVPVNFSVTSGGVAVTQGTTDANGMASAVVSTVGNSTPRTITLTATAGGVNGTVDIAVIGTAGAGSQTVASISGTTDVASIPADGSANAQIKFYVRNANNQLIAGVPVTISASSGGVTVTQATTDANGIAAATLSTAGNSTARTITVTGTAGGFSATVDVKVVAAAGSGTNAVQTVTVSSSAASIPADGSSPAQIKVYVRNASNVLLANVPVTFASSSGAITVTQGTTDASGLATATLATGGDATIRNITVTASAGGQSGSTTVAVANTVSTVAVSASAQTITSDGSATATLTANVRNAGNVGVAGVLVTFSSTAGSLSVSQAVTDGSGNATAVLSATGVAAGTSVTVTAGAGGQTGTAAVSVINPVSTVSVASSAPSIPSDGTSSVTVSATVRDAASRPIVGVPVTFAAPTGQLSSAQGVTNASGVASVTLNAGSNSASRNITVTASAGGQSGTVSVSVFAPIRSVIVTSSVASIPTDGSASATITATVRDSGNAAVAGVPVSFAANSGGIVVTQAVTDVNGVATATLSTAGDPTARTITVTATAAGIAGTASVQVSGSSALAVSNVSLSASNTTIPTDGSVSSIITVTVRNASNVVLAGVPVSFSASSGSLVVTQAVTDVNGNATATLSTGGNATARTITVSATAAGIGNSTSVTVGGFYIVTATASAPTVASDGSAPVEIRAYIRNPSNQFLAGVPVSFSATSGGLSLTNATTDASGSATATLAPAGDPSSRTITVTVTGGGVSAQVNVDVVGSRLTIQGPATLTLSQTGTYSIQLVDSGNKAIAGKLLGVSSRAGNTLSASSVTTDSSGRAAITLTATSATTDTLTVSGLGIIATQGIAVSSDSFTFTSPAANSEINLGATQQVKVTWLRSGVAQVGQTISFATTRGVVTSSAVTDANGVATVNLSSDNAGGATVTATAGGNSVTRTFEFVATTPASITLQPDAFTLSPGQSTNVTAVVRDAANNLVKNQTVTFTVQDVSGGTLSVGSAITDSLGRAWTVYTASSMTSASNGVKVTGTVQSINGSVSLTVAQRALFISLGTGNTISKPTSPQYQVQFVAQVTDSNGNGVAGVTVSTKILSKYFYKGFRVAPAGLTNLWTTTQTVQCADEDVNHNGILDPGEDVNGSGLLEAGNVATVMPSTATTDANGFVALTVTYPASYAYYVSVDLSASATVSGTSFVRTSSFTLPGLRDDFTDPNVPPGLNSPFGRGESPDNVCTNLN